MSNGLIQSSISGIEFLLLALILGRLEVIVHVVRPHVIITCRLLCVASRKHLSSIGCNPLMHDSNVCLTLHFNSLSGCFRFGANYSQKFATLETGVGNLSLEWNFFELLNINLHKLEVLIISNFILKRYFSVYSCIGKLLNENSFIIFQKSRLFVTEYQSFMEHNLSLYI
jgi:hypothetical protein